MSIDPSTSSTAVERMMDPDEIRRAMQAILRPGQVAEIRALEATMRGERYAQTISGYFNDIEAMILAVSQITSAAGVYFIPNHAIPRSWPAP